MLEEKLEALRGEFRKVRKTFDNEAPEIAGLPRARTSQKRQDGPPPVGRPSRPTTPTRTWWSGSSTCKVLDPAMGSGHFLVEAVDFITDRLLKFLNQFPINPVNFALERTRTASWNPSASRASRSIRTS